MWARAFRLLGIVVASVFLGHLIGSNWTQPEAVTLPPPTSGFLVGNLSIQPAEVQPNEIVTITVSVANTHDTWGIYSLVLNINGVKEAEKQATVDAGTSQNVSFSLTREDPGSYNVFINGLSGSFTVVAPPLVPPEVKPPPPEVKPPVNWPLIGGIIAGVVAVVLFIVLYVVRIRK